MVVVPTDPPPEFKRMAAPTSALIPPASTVLIGVAVVGLTAKSLKSVLTAEDLVVLPPIVPVLTG